MRSVLLWPRLLVLALVAIVAVGAIAFAEQRSSGLAVTGLTSDVPWGLYVAQLTFSVGVAASSVMVALPYYLHDDRDFGRLVLFGEAVSIAAVVCSELFVFVDLGQPTRVFNVLLHPSPGSVMFWDFLVLTGYLVINAALWWSGICALRGGTARPRWYKPLAILSVPWAFAIHTVTALLYAGLVARGGWLSAILAPRFLASAFAAGPAILVLVAMGVRRYARVDVGLEAVPKLMTIVTYALAAHLVLSLLEVFPGWYGGDAVHAAHLQAALLGDLAPFSWGGMILATGALVALLVSGSRRRGSTTAVVCAATVGGVWVEKGFAFIVGGFIPSALGATPRYVPTIVEGTITAGVYAVGALIAFGLGGYTVATLRREPRG